MFKFALLLDNLINCDEHKAVIDEIYRSQKDVTIFLLNKNNTIPCMLPIFNISNYWGWNGVTIVTSHETLEKADTYPTSGPIIVIGNIPNRICVNHFNLNIIEDRVNEYFAGH